MKLTTLFLNLKHLSKKWILFCSLFALTACPEITPIPGPGLSDCENFSVGIVDPLNHIYIPRTGTTALEAGFTLYDFYHAVFPFYGVYTDYMIADLHENPERQNEIFSDNFILSLDQSLALFEQTHPRLISDSFCNTEIFYQPITPGTDRFNAANFQRIYNLGDVLRLQELIVGLPVTDQEPLRLTDASDEVIEDALRLRVGLVIPEFYNTSESSVGYFGPFNFLHLLFDQDLFAFENSRSIQKNISRIRLEELNVFQEDINWHLAEEPPFNSYLRKLHAYGGHHRDLAMASVFSDKAALAEIYYRGYFGLSAPFTLQLISDRHRHELNSLTLLAAKDWGIYDFSLARNRTGLSVYEPTVTNSDGSEDSAFTSFRRALKIAEQNFAFGVNGAGEFGLGSLYQKVGAASESRWQKIDHPENSSLSPKASYWIDQSRSKAYFLKHRILERNLAFDFQNFDQLVELSWIDGEAQITPIELELYDLSEIYRELSTYTAIVPAINTDQPYAIIFTTSESIYYWDPSLTEPVASFMDALDSTEKVNQIIKQGDNYYLFTQKSENLDGSIGAGYRAIISYQLDINLTDYTIEQRKLAFYPTTSTEPNIFYSLQIINDQMALFHNPRRNYFGLLIDGKIVLPTENLSDPSFGEGFFTIEDSDSYPLLDTFYRPLVPVGDGYSVNSSTLAPIHPHFFINEGLPTDSQTQRVLESYLNVFDHEFNSTTQILRLNLSYTTIENNPEPFTEGITEHFSFEVEFQIPDDL